MLNACKLVKNPPVGWIGIDSDFGGEMAGVGGGVYQAGTGCRVSKAAGDVLPKVSKGPEESLPRPLLEAWLPTPVL